MIAQTDIAAASSIECRQLTAAAVLFEQAAEGSRTLVSTLLAIGDLLPVLLETTTWPSDCVAPASEMNATIRRLFPVLVADVSGRIQAETICFGLGCLSSLVANPGNEFAKDQFAYSRILLAELMIVRDRRELVGSGDAFLREFRSWTAWSQPGTALQLQ